MNVNQALSLATPELHLVQDVLEEAVAMHAEPEAVRQHAVEVICFNLQVSACAISDQLAALDELLAHYYMPTDHLLIAIGILRESDFGDQADALQLAIYDRSKLFRAVPQLELHLRNLQESRTPTELRARHSAWRALEYLTFNARVVDKARYAD